MQCILSKQLYLSFLVRDILRLLAIESVTGTEGISICQKEVCKIADELGFYNTVGDYLEGSVDHSSDKKDLTITLMNDSGDDAAVWTVSSAWVTKYTGPDLNSTSSDISIETIEIAHEGLRRTR